MRVNIAGRRLVLLKFSGFGSGTAQKHIFILIVLSLFTRLGYFLTNIFFCGGLPQAYDTQWYIEHANLLLSSFHIDMDFNGVFYIGYYAPLAILLFVFKSEVFIVFIQMLVNALCVVPVYRIASILFNERTAFFSGLFYIATWPLVYWSMFILTDSFFVALLLALTYFLVMFFESRRNKYLALFVLGALYTVFYRPNGIITAVIMSIYIIIRMDAKVALEKLRRRKVGVAIILTAIVLTVAAVLESGVINGFLSDLSYNFGGLLMSHYATGQIFDQPTQYDYIYEPVFNEDYFNSFNLSFLINNWKEMLIIFSRRAAYFWAVAFWKLSPGKLYFAAAYLFGLIGIIGVAMKKMLKQTSVLLLLIASIQIFCILFFIDGSFRYRVPALVFLNFFAAFGADFVLNKIQMHARER